MTIEYVYDIECYKNYFLATFFNVKDETWHEYHLGKALLDDIILNSDVLLVGWNNAGYDDVLLKYIAERSLPPSPQAGFFKDKPEPINEHDLYLLSGEIIEQGYDCKRVRELRWKDSEFDSIDVKSVLDPMPSLKKTEIRMRYYQVQDLPYDPHTELTDFEKEQVRLYCRNDVGATTAIYLNHATEHIYLRQYLASRFNLPANKLRSMSEPKTAEFILSSLACKAMDKPVWEIRNTLEKEPVTFINLTKSIPDWIYFDTPVLQNLLAQLKETKLPINPDTGYAIGSKITQLVTIGSKQYKLGIGGLHSVDKPYNWRALNGERLIDADVTSYYPSILLRDNLHPRGYSPIWIDTYRDIYDTRLKAKKAENNVEANALKIVLNATFGKLGSKFSTFYDPQLLIQVTLTGQLALLMLIERYEINSIEVISANTDGVLVRLDKRQMDTFRRVNDIWQLYTKFNLEYAEYKKYARRDVNNYTAVTTDNKIKAKGIYKGPDLKHDVQAPIVQRMASAYLLNDLEPEEYLNEIIGTHLELTIYDYLFSFSATKVFEVFLNDQPLSRSNRWYVSSKPLDNQLYKVGGIRGGAINIPNGKNIVLMNTINKDTVPSDIDLSYYIAAANKLIINSIGNTYEQEQRVSLLPKQERILLRGISKS